MKTKLSNLFFFTVSSILTVFSLPTTSSTPSPHESTYNSTLARETVSSAVHTLMFKYYYQENNIFFVREYLGSIIESELLLFGFLSANQRTQFTSQELEDIQKEVDSFASYQYIEKFKGMEDMIESAILKPSPSSNHLQNLFSKDLFTSSFADVIQNDENRQSLVDAIIDDDNIDRFMTLYGQYRISRQKSISATEFLEHKLNLNLTRVKQLFEDSNLLWITILDLIKAMKEPKNDQELYSIAQKIQGSANITRKQLILREGERWKENMQCIMFYEIIDDFLKILQGEKQMMRAMNFTEFELIVEVLDSVQSYKGQKILSYYKQNQDKDQERYTSDDKLRQDNNRIEAKRLEKKINEQKQLKDQGGVEQALKDQQHYDQNLSNKIDSIVQKLREMQDGFQDLKADQERFNEEIKDIQGSIKDLEKNLKRSNNNDLLKQGQQDQIKANQKQRKQQEEQDENKDIMEDSEKSKTKIVNKDENSKDNEDDDGFASIKVLLYSAAATLLVVFGILAWRRYQIRKLNRELAFQHDIMKEEEL